MSGFLDLPLEIQRTIVEACDVKSRLNLRSTLILKEEIVDQTKFVLQDVSFHLWNTRSLRISFYFEEKLYHKIERGIETADAMEKTAKWIGSVFKNAEFSSLAFVVCPECRDRIKNFLLKVKGYSGSLWKAREIFCAPKIDPFWICDTSYLQRLLGEYDDPNFFRDHKEIIMNLDVVELTTPMNITDQDVLSMKSKDMYLVSENFSVEMIQQMVDTFVAEGLMNSKCRLKNPKETNLISKIKIPDGFALTEERGLYAKIDGNKKMQLSLRNKSVWFEIGPQTR